MTITLALTPETEQKLLARAEARGVSVAEFVEELVAREAAEDTGEARNLVELFANSPFRGLNMDFERDKDYGREIEL